ncbi:hypothetical protein [Asanoa iriomotensis]|uniref:Uncharacterized protein n=1 Tax=Asanoa iriomotensis TaxID=234613 RepID=A0ABQ4C7V1_9ACTN|nr:hypothetical protein [Asanoa iriomotensis]GIF58866.1 hypothetical protein Air01nite_49610 [Asanoa iriomotensis]
MTDQLPRERDLPPGRHAHLRSRVLAGIAEPARPRRRYRLALAAAVALAVVAGTVFALGRTGQPEIYALGDSALSERVREAGRQCLRGVGEIREGETPGEPWPSWPADAPPTLLNHVEQPGRGALVVYETRAGELIYCSIGVAGHAAFMGHLPGSAWLPGSASIELAETADLDGGLAAAAGRVSDRVARVVLDDGAGHRSTAKLARGTFVVFSNGPLAPGAGVLTSYDASGVELHRWPLFRPEPGRCYLDPTGAEVNPANDYVLDEAYQADPTACGPAEPWSR